MSRFRITASLCGQCAKEIESLADSLHLSSTQVKETGVRLTAVMSGAPKAQRRSCEQSLDEAGDAARALGRTLGELVRRYQSAEGRVLESASSEKAAPVIRSGKFLDNGGIFDWIRKFFGDTDYFTEEEVDNIITKGKGGYGGDQGSPARQWGFWSHKKEMYDTVRSHYPDMTDAQIKEYLKKYNSEGCGYVAIANTIMAAYEGREDEFERTFGFPMRDRWGRPNYDRLTLDLYCETDNHHPDGRGGDTIDSAEDESATKGVGTTPGEQKYRGEKYLHDHGVDAEIRPNQQITVDNVDHYMEEGSVIINYYYGALENEDGSTAAYIDGGHAMYVTGRTSDGRFIVSSWGKKYYIDPGKTYAYPDKDHPGQQNTTGMNFSLVTYK